MAKSFMRIHWKSKLQIVTNRQILLSRHFDTCTHINNENVDK